MHITRFTDYALRTLVYVGVNADERCTSAEIAEAFGISEHHVAKAAQWLTREGYLHAFRGKGGGVSLARPAAEILLAEIVKSAEPLELLECFDAATNTCPIAGVCRLERLLHQARAAFLASLADFTLADVIRNRRQLLVQLGG
jgi:Rrf2 family nitric oxide-sensitive transcriptional repressor